MKLSVMQENLARGLSVVSRAVGSGRATLPVLSNVLLRTEDAGLKLTATNLEIGISTWVPGKIEHEGALTVPARLITDVVNGLAAGERIKVQDGETGYDVEFTRVIEQPGKPTRSRRYSVHYPMLPVRYLIGATPKTTTTTKPRTSTTTTPTTRPSGPPTTKPSGPPTTKAPTPTA